MFLPVQISDLGFLACLSNNSDYFDILLSKDGRGHSDDLYLYGLSQHRRMQDVHLRRIRTCDSSIMAVQGRISHIPVYFFKWRKNKEVTLRVTQGRKLVSSEC
jgi:hypothetical protein